MSISASFSELKELLPMMKMASEEEILAVMTSGAELLEDLLSPDPKSFTHQKATKVTNKRKLPRTRLRGDPRATLEQYRERITAERSDEDWESLSGAWLSDYGLYSEDACPTHHAHAIIAIARDKGVFVNGVCAENKKNGVYVHSVLPDGSERSASNVVYIGGYNRFTSQESSIWAILPVDKVVL